VRQEDLLAVYDFYILTLANPDGYEYSWTKDRMWRKNRRPLAAVQAAQQQQPAWGPPATQSTKAANK
jgi:murein tripeptide amidase MpaA